MQYGEPRQLSTPTWSAGTPCQRAHKHHHQHHHLYHHHYHHQWTPSCCCPPSSSSPHNNAENPSHSQHTHRCPSHITAKHAQIGDPPCTCIALAGILPSAPLICIEHGRENAYALAPPCTRIALVAHIVPSAPLTCTQHGENALHNLAPAIPPISPFTESDLYAAPTRSSKRPKRPRTCTRTVFPPLPSSSSPPYILCQHCFQLLLLPLQPLDGAIDSSVFKLKCALCMAVSIFSTRHRCAFPSSDASQMGPITANGELTCKEELKNRSQDEPAINSDGVSKVESDQRVAKANVFLLSDDGNQHETEEGTKHKHLGTTDVSKAVQTSMPPSPTAIDASKGKQSSGGDDAVVTNTDMPINDTRGGASTCEETPPRLNPEFAGFSTVQDWVNSLEHGGFSYCPMPRTGFESDLQVEIDDHQGNDMVVLPVPGSPLHEHFGYKSARQLLYKAISFDDEYRALSDTNSSVSTSNSSANTFKPAGFDTVGPPLRSSLQQLAKDHVKSNIRLEQEDQTSLANLLKRSFMGFGDRKSLSMPNSKSRVVVNGHELSESAVKRAEERAGKLQPGVYWYDRVAGFWGIIGGPCLGVLPPFIEELHYPMTRNCSTGDTKVFVNGRELHRKDLAILSHRGLSKRPGRSYKIGFDGVVVEEASGQEQVHLGKLAPTVEKRGKGFGMYMEKPR